MATVPAIPLQIEEALGATEVARILGVHRRTAERRRTAAQRPKPLEAQRVEKLQRIWKKLLELYTLENDLKWLHSSMPALGDKRPLDVMAEDGGLDRVLDTVARMSWGIPA
jgi:putative toxin-antitoxin system antitoxin component (TIGR02293 family)